MVSMKSRLQRLLGRQSRFRKSINSASDCSSTMITMEISSNSSTGSSIAESDDLSSFGPTGDPYADVRDQMEALSARDKARFADPNHTTDHRHLDEQGIPALIAYLVYLSYAILIFIGHLRDLCAMVFRRGRYLRQKTGYPSDQLEHYAPLLKSWENFFTRRMYSRIIDVFNRPIASNPGAQITVLERASDDNLKSMKLLGKLDNVDSIQQRREYQRGGHFVTSHDGMIARKCVNLGSYNYLGFADDWAETCAYDVKGTLQELPVSASSSRNEFGTTALHREVEQTVASFLGKEDALVLNMGFNTNATTIPALVGRGDLLISDELNHTSIVNGARASGASIRIFRHNDMKHLEEIIKQNIILGRPRTRRPWNKILVIVEGIYSMEGEYSDLRNVVRICKQYGAYVYLDEAHSIGAMGPTGRGLSEYTSTDTADIDIMMGTFTKSFGGMGGYIAADKETIDFLRRRCSGSAYHNSLSPVVAQQVLTSLKVIMGQDHSNLGKLKLQALRDNSNYFRMRLRQMGLQVLGHYDSPIMPVMLYHPAKIAAFSRECLKRGLAVVVVGFPAVPLLESRARFCISAGHTREMLDAALKDIDEIADMLGIRYNDKSKPELSDAY